MSQHTASGKRRRQHQLSRTRRTGNLQQERRSRPQIRQAGFIVDPDGADPAAAAIKPAPLPGAAQQKFIKRDGIRRKIFQHPEAADRDGDVFFPQSRIIEFRDFSFYLNLRSSSGFKRLNPMCSLPRNLSSVHRPLSRRSSPEKLIRRLKIHEITWMSRRNCKKLIV